jgi:2,4-dienoyl-CoA reductase-like NADH-dependent reductase (Old Yellow Enzyme family)/thioredoxin reductase
MTDLLPHLFAPGHIGSLTTKNRILKSPQATLLAAPDGTVTERLTRHYRRIARGGVGLIVVEYTYIDDDASKALQCELGASSGDHLPGLAWLADVIHAEGALAGLQIGHCGRQKFYGEPPLKAPSAVPWPKLHESTGAVPQELTVAEIDTIVESFGGAAERAASAGFDLVEIHAGHGYLPTNFLSPHTNKRTDSYGGSLENRMRFVLRVVETVRRQVPAGFTVTMRVSASDYEPGGILVEDTVVLCKRAEELGLDAVHVSGGDHETINFQISPGLFPRGLHVAAAESIKAALSIPVIASGALLTPEAAEAVLATGKADFVSLGRPLLADPEWPRKALEGRQETIRPCIRCNDGCLWRSVNVGKGIACSVDPTLGHEEQYELEPARRRRRVAVVGGGPAGLEIAWVLATRGHEVALYERRALGGRLLEATAPAFKTDLAAYRGYLVERLKGLELELHETEAHAQSLLDAGFDVAVVATGARPKALPIPGAEQTVHAVALPHNTGDVSDSRVVVIGGGFTGSETTLRLAQAGAEVTLIEACHELMRGDVVQDRLAYAARLAEAGPRVLTNSRAVRVTDAGVLVEGPAANGELPADQVIVAVGYEPDGTLADDLRARAGPPVHVIGDAVAPGRVHDAIHQAYRVGRLL